MKDATQLGFGFGPWSRRARNMYPTYSPPPCIRSVTVRRLLIPCFCSGLLFRQSIRDVSVFCPDVGISLIIYIHIGMPTGPVSNCAGRRASFLIILHVLYGDFSWRWFVFCLCLILICCRREVALLLQSISLFRLHQPALAGSLVQLRPHRGRHKCRHCFFL